MSKYFDGEKLSGNEESPIPCIYGGNLEECYKKITDLQSQLAEKEKEIEKLKIILNMQAVQASEEQRLSLINTNCIQYNQNQKAIEQLEKVKEIVKHFCEIHSDDYYGVKSQVMGIRQDVFEFIDQQIKELKGKVEE